MARRMSRPRTALVLASGFLALAGGCRRSTGDWARDLTSPDPWRREMAALALRSVEDEEVEHAVRLLLQKLSDPEPRVVLAISDSLASLAPRAVEPLAQALELLPPERAQHRALLVRLLTERAAAGDERARSALLGHLRAELASGSPERVELARAHLRELGEDG